MATTKIYKNTSKDPITVTGIGEIPAGEIVSITTDFQPPVVLENFPGVIDITDTADRAQDQLVGGIDAASADQKESKNE